MTGRAGKVALLLALTWACIGAARADVTVTTQTLRLTFGANGNLDSAIACFPSCSGGEVRLQQFGDEGVLDFGGLARGRWTAHDDPVSGRKELRYMVADRAALTWRIPERGYRIELEMSTAADLTLRSGVSFRPRDASGFGRWLEQSRYVLVEDGEVTQIGLDEDEATSIEVEGWLGYRNRYWALVVAPPKAAAARLAGEPERQDAEISVATGGEGTWSFYLGPIEPEVLKSADPELSPVRLESYRSDHIQLDYRGQDSGWVVLPMRAYPGWRARVDGQDVEPARFLDIMPAIPVRGPSRIDFRYVPGNFYTAAAISLSGWGILLLLVLRLRKR